MRHTSLAALLLLAACSGRAGDDPRDPGDDPASPAAATLDIFFMSQCPYSAEIIGVLPEVVRRAEGTVDVRWHAVVFPDGAGGFEAMHGPQEFFGNVLYLCAADLAADDESAAVFGACMARGMATLPFGWEDCADEAAIPTQPMKECALGTRGEELISASWDAAVEHMITASPYVVIDGLPHNAGGSADDLFTALCCAMEPGERPSACPSQPSCYNMRVDLVVITDARCSDCDDVVQGVVETLLLPFPALEVRTLDWTDEAGRELWDLSGLELLPAFLFEENVKQSAAYPVLEGAAFEVPGWTVLSPDALEGPLFDPEAEICDNGADDTGDGLVDCDDPDCIGRPLCREPIPGKLDLFVMAFCPFGRNAMAVADRVWTHFEGELTVELHWITTELTAGAGAWDDLPERCGEWGGRIFCSLHGTEETAEDLRQICIQDRYGTPRLMDYLRCLHGAADGTPWSECASAAGIDDGEIGLCAGGLEGPELLSADAALVEALGVDGSPTWMWDNHIVESISATPEAVAARACELHPDLGGCETLDEIESAPTGIGSDAKCWD